MGERPGTTVQQQPSFRTPTYRRPGRTHREVLQTMCDRTGQDMVVTSPAAKENTQSSLYTHALTHTHMRTLRYSYSHTCIYSHISIGSCTHVHTPTHIHLCSHTHTPAIIHLYTHTRTCFPTHKLTHIHLNTQYTHTTGIGSSSGVQALSSCVQPQGSTKPQWKPPLPQSPRQNTHNQLLVGCKVSELDASWQG